MSIFSTTVTKAQRNTTDFDTRGKAISACSRHNTKRPGYSPSPFEPKISEAKPKPWSLGAALAEKVLGKDTTETKVKKIKVTAQSKRINDENKRQTT